MLTGCRVLLADDEPLVVELLRDMLLDAEAVIIGPAANVREAREIVRQGTKIDVAVLDLNFSDGVITPVLEALAGRAIPMIVHTGGTLPHDLRKRHPDLTVLPKPVSPARLLSELRRVTHKVVEPRGVSVRLA